MRKNPTGLSHTLGPQHAPLRAPADIGVVAEDDGCEGPHNREWRRDVENFGYACHRTATDRIPARQVVTAQFMGDPRPGRSAQEQLELRRGRASA